jgi:hypothetical protein
MPVVSAAFSSTLSDRISSSRRLEEMGGLTAAAFVVGMHRMLAHLLPEKSVARVD